MASNGERLSGKITGQLNILQTAFEIHSSGDRLPALPKPWSALSVGGDWWKLIAANSELGIVAKRYATPEYARLVNQGYELIRPAIEKSKFPLLLPLGFHTDMIVFPLIKEFAENTQDFDAILQLRRLLQGISLPLDLASSLDRIRTINGIYFYNDPFEDSFKSLYDRTGVVPHNF